MSKTILTPEQEQEIVCKYKAGSSKNALHLEYKVSEGTIKRALKRNNVFVRLILAVIISIKIFLTKKKSHKIAPIFWGC